MELKAPLAYAHFSRWLLSDQQDQGPTTFVSRAETGQVTRNPVSERANMKHPVVPFAMPRTIAPDLARVRAYWESLKRGANDMPFWDDVKISSLPDLSDRLLLVDVFEKPQRFRLNFVGQQLISRYGESITKSFIDEMELKYPLHYLASQCCATVESRAPTYYAFGAVAAGESRGLVAYSRILLPMWGDGHIGMLLGALKWH